MQLRRWIWIALLGPAWAEAAVVQVGQFQLYTTVNAGIAASSDGDTILISAGTYTEEVLLWDRSLFIWGAGGAGAVTIRSPGLGGSNVVQIVGGTISMTGITVDGRGERRGMIVQSAADVGLEDVVFVNGTNADGFPGGGLDVYAASTVDANNVSFDNNSAYIGLRPMGGHVAVEVGSDFGVGGDGLFTNGGAARGGAVYVDGTSQAYLIGAQFDDNHATGVGDNDGGAICGDPGSYTEVNQSSFSRNSSAPDADSWGGAIYGGDVEVYDSDFDDNVGAYRGGAIAIDASSMTASGNIFTANSAIQGGAVYCKTPVQCLVDDSWFARNQSERGGAFMISQGAAVLTGNTFCANSVPEAYGGPTKGDGGAILSVFGTVTATNNVFYENAASEDGGALAMYDSVVAMTSNHFVGNVAARGGAVLLGSEALSNVYSSTNNLYGWNSEAVSDVAGTATGSYDLYFNNNNGNGLGTDPTDIVGLDPLLLSYEPGSPCRPLRLLPTEASPLIDNGHPAISDPDGTRSDIGAFGGADADPNLFKDGDGDGLIAMFDCDDGDPLEQGAMSYVYNDGDGDGFGDYYDMGQLGCVGANSPATHDDCDDGDPLVRFGPGWFEDSDGDGLGNAATRSDACERPPGWVTDGTDCDDTDPGVSGPMAWYDDLDGDGFGDPATEVFVCVPLPGQVENDRDCSPAIALLNPDTTWYRDGDSDGLGDDDITLQQCDQPTGYGFFGGDCDDDDAAIGGPVLVYFDGDSDGYGAGSALPQTQCLAPGVADNNLDCDDAAADLNPETLWYPDDDDDGLGGEPAVMSCEGPAGHTRTPGDCDDSAPDIGEPSTWYLDVDGDGFADDLAPTLFDCPTDGYVADLGDCDDGDSAVYPDAPEVCDDVDSDCDGDYNDAEGADTLVLFADHDDDGFGDASQTAVGCPGPGWSTDNTDCDDLDPASYPGADEVWYDGIDQNCDGMSDYDRDLDGFDRYGEGDDGLDCDDDDDAIHPGVKDIMDDRIDQNCDGVVASSWMVGGVRGCSTAPVSVGWVGLLLVALCSRRRG